MIDLSHILPGDPITALAPTSQAGGNMMSDNKLAGTAPGSPPVDPLPPAREQNDPKVTASNATPLQPGDDGKPDASKMTGYTPARPAWRPASPPQTVRKQQ